jgi:PPOX class probable F420-dependent enzyme
MAAGVARLATLDAQHGGPHLVPICFVLAADTVYSVVDQKPKRSTRLHRLANVEADPRASLLVDYYSEDWTKLWWDRLDCTARIVTDTVTDTAERSAALERLAAKYVQYRDVELSGTVLALDILRWTSWQASS